MIFVANKLLQYCWRNISALIIIEDQSSSYSRCLSKLYGIPSKERGDSNMAKKILMYIHSNSDKKSTFGLFLTYCTLHNKSRTLQTGTILFMQSLCFTAGSNAFSLFEIVSCRSLIKFPDGYRGIKSFF